MLINAVGGLASFANGPHDERLTAPHIAAGKNFLDIGFVSQSVSRDIAARINQQVGLSRNESATIVESILAHMSDALAAGQNVKISGFGTFVLRDKAERVGRNPKTGIEVPILPRRVMTVRASQAMRARVAGK